MKLRELKLAAAAGTLLILAPLAAPIDAQTAEIPRRTVPYSWTSGRHHGAGDASKAPGVAREGVISVPGAPWVQLNFRRGRLGRHSFLEITSLADGAVQTLDSVDLERWRDHSAFFNGDAVRLRLFVGPRDRDVSIDVAQVVAGESGPPGVKSLCGGDDRVASNEPRVARIDPVGCTGFVIDGGQHLTAGHCLALGSVNQTLSFNVPPSLPDGTVQFPAPQFQYSINTSSFEFVNGDPGNDWGIFAVFNNTQTGLQPIQAQGSFTIKQDLGPATIRITGFGVDGGSASQTNQTSAGPNAGSSGTTMRYATDTEGGNSGGPVIDAATGFSVGIHTHGGCFQSGGNNSGTSFFNGALWNAVDHVPAPRIIGQRGRVSNLTHQPRTVVFGRSYTKPVVIAQPLTVNGSAAAAVRVTDVRPDRFTLYVDQPPNLSGVHPNGETVSYLVLEAGQWVAAGQRLSVGSVTTSKTVGQLVSSQWQRVNLGGFGQVPVVITQVQTNRDPSWVKTRVQNVSNTGFDVALEEEEASAASHGTEVVGWLAFRPGASNWDGKRYEAVRTPAAVTDDGYTVSFLRGMSDIHFLAGIESYNGPDAAHLRYGALTSFDVQVRVEEDTTRDAETDHVGEVVAYVAIAGSGTLTAVPWP
ncbi:MAG TPA: trypsin-like peptidase domain-containing protein [Thermoanaerobaculia bacterium]